MVALPSSLLAPPVRRRDHVVRARLEAVLGGAAEARLILLSAPAGFGKTTLLAEWLKRRARRYAWLTLDEASNDEARFRRSLVDALDLASRAGLEQADAPPSLEAVIDRIAALAARERLVLVLDDYQVITQPDVHQVVAGLIDRLPATAQLVLATRSDPPVRVARLRARGELVELRAADLRFNRDEVAVLLASLGLELEPPEVDRLTERTEGWAAALQLAAVSLRGGPDPRALVDAFGASNRFVLDFIVDEVLDRVGEEVREFLLATSVLERLSGPLCDAVTGSTGGGAMLERLERDNLLIFPLDQERRWYRYHGLFRDLLAARLVAADPGRPARLHGRAGAWYESHGLLEPAVFHALAAGDHAAAAARIRGCWMRIMHAGELRIVERWLDALPRDAVRRDAQLSAVYAWGRVLRREPGGIEERLADAEAVLAAGAGQLIDRLLVPSQLASIRAILAGQRGDHDAAVEHARHAIELVPQGIDGDLRALLEGDATSLLGNAYLASGDDTRAADAFRAAIPLLRRGGNHLGVAHGLRDLARIERRAGRLAASLEVAREGLAAAGPDAAQPAYAAVGLARAETLAAQGKRDAARVEASRAEALARRGGEELVARQARAFVAALEARDGDGPAGAGRVDGLVEALTAREQEVLELVATGDSNSQIAARLFVTVGTVKSHVHALTGKLGASNRVGAIARARELGLLD